MDSQNPPPDPDSDDTRDESPQNDATEATVACPVATTTLTGMAAPLPTAGGLVDHKSDSSPGPTDANRRPSNVPQQGGSGADSPSGRSTPRSRRQVLALAASGVSVGLTGCAWAQSSSAPDRAENSATPAPVPEGPGFELVSVDYPETIELLEPVRYTFTVKNTGGQNHFETTIQSVNPATKQSYDHQVTMTIPLGETKPITVDEPSFRYLGRRDIRIDVFDREFTIQGVGKTYDVGDWAWGHPITEPDARPLPNNQFLSIKDVEMVGAETQAQTQRWLIVTVFAINSTGGPDAGSKIVTSPPATAYFLETPAGEFEPVNPPALVAPPEFDDNRYEATELTPQESILGLLAFPVPDGVAVAELRVGWKRTFDEGTLVLYWEP